MPLTEVRANSESIFDFEINTRQVNGDHTWQSWKSFAGGKGYRQKSGEVFQLPWSCKDRFYLQ